MTGIALAIRQVRYENRTFWRNPAAAFFTFVFPLMLLVIFNLIFGEEDLDIPGGTASTATFYVPAIAAMAVISACYTNIAMMVTIARDRGELKRKRGTPLPAWAFLFGRIAHATLLSLVLVTLVTAFGAIFYDVEVPASTMPAFIVTLTIGSMCFCALGLAVTAFIPNADAAPAIVNATILPLLFISDVFIPLNDAPDWLLAVGDIFPVKHFSEALQTAFNPYETGSGFEHWSLVVLAIWGVIGALVAWRRFSWEPRN
jgi:ABC-2 type transport system permease protein